MGYTFPLGEFEKHPTPFYFYDLNLLGATLDAAKEAAAEFPSFRLHYAVKANFDRRILRIAAEKGFGADIVSGGELALVNEAGFAPGSIVFAGVGKTDHEIASALDTGIGCFNVESVPELENIGRIAGEKGVKAQVALRVNPNIDAHTHHLITTGLQDNKFGINIDRLDSAVDMALAMDNIDLAGLHFHIGSQITILYPFELLCDRVNLLLEKFTRRGVRFRSINLGGGLGVDYDNPDKAPIPDFKSVFRTVGRYLNVAPGQEVHFELGRSLVAQCGSLITRILYIKEGHSRKFAIVDAGMSELIRPALYQASHMVENLSAMSRGETSHKPYDVVGPICETSDTFGEAIVLPLSRRGDIVAIRSAGAYGESMASHYNCRFLYPTLYSDSLP